MSVVRSLPRRALAAQARPVAHATQGPKQQASGVVTIHVGVARPSWVGRARAATCPAASWARTSSGRWLCLRAVEI